MAVKTSSILPFPVTSIPDRLTPVGVFDKTVVTTTAGTEAFKRLNRLQGADFQMAVPIQEVTEMGAQLRPGGIDELGEITWKLDYSAVGLGNTAAVCGVALSTTAGATNTIGLTQFQTATTDIFRFVADPNNNVFGTYYFQDCIIEDYTVDIKEKSVVSESISGKGPNGLAFGGFVLPKVYVATSTDVTNGYLTLTSLLSASEGFVQMPLPAAGTELSYWQQNYANFFLKIEKLPGGSLTATPVRYKDNINASFQTGASISSTAYITPSTFIPDIQVGASVQLGVGTANVENVTVTAVASQVNTTSTAGATAGSNVTITPVSMLGIFPGVTVQMANANGTASETQPVASTTSTTFTVATLSSTKTANFTITTVSPSFQANVTKTHAANDPINMALSAAQANIGNAVFIPSGSAPSYSGGKLYLGDSFAAGDAFRLVMLSYNTDAANNPGVPVSVPANSPDTTDRAGVSARFVPVQINGLGTKRAQSLSFKFSFKRDPVNGVGEKSMVYGVPSIPDVAISLDYKEYDLTLLSQLKTGSANLSSQGGTIKNDAIDLQEITRLNLQNTQPISAQMFDPFNPQNILMTFQCPHFVVKNFGVTSSNKADNSLKVTAEDISGSLTISATNPQ